LRSRRDCSKPSVPANGRATSRARAAIPLRDMRYFAARVRTAQVITNPTSHAHGRPAGSFVKVPLGSTAV
jgi:hypothetical protein